MIRVRLRLVSEMIEARLRLVRGMIRLRLRLVSQMIEARLRLVSEMIRLRLRLVSQMIEARLRLVRRFRGMPELPQTPGVHKAFHCPTAPHNRHCKKLQSQGQHRGVRLRCETPIPKNVPYTMSQSKEADNVLSNEDSKNKSDTAVLSPKPQPSSKKDLGDGSISSKNDSSSKAVDKNTTEKAERVDKKRQSDNSNLTKNQNENCPNLRKDGISDKESAQRSAYIDRSRGVGDNKSVSRNGSKAVGSTGKDRSTPARYSESRERRDATDKTFGRGDWNRAGAKSSRDREKKDASSPLAGLPKMGNNPNQGKIKSASDLEKQWQKEEEEKRQKAEAERLEEEKKQKEEEKKLEEARREEEEKQRKKEEELKSLKEFVHDAGERLETKKELRDTNIIAIENRPDESFFGKLDSSLKRNTAFVKKLRTLSESQKESLMKDFTGLNLTKYIGEAASAITEAKLKMSDVHSALVLCSLLHQRYPDFSSTLLENWQRYLLSKKDDKISNPSKYRVDLRFFAELTSVRVFTEKEGLPVLSNQLSLLLGSDKEEHNNLSIITSFCKHCGDEYMGLVPRKIRLLSEKYNMAIPRSQLLLPERQKACRNLLKEYYTSLCKHLTKEYKELRSMERQNRRILQSKGELNVERKEKYDAAYAVYQKLHLNTATFADLLDEDLPELPEEEIKSEGLPDVFNPDKSEFQYEGDMTLFEDEDARTFYESLPDLKAFIPGICYKDSEGNDIKHGLKEEETGLEDDMEGLQIEDVEMEMETEKQIAEEAKEAEIENNEPKDEKEEQPSMEELGFVAEADEDESDTGNLMKMQFEAYIQSLPNCVNRELIDKAAIEFCMNFNTKINRKKLVRGLFTVHRTRYDLLPFYARFTATLLPCMPDVANDLAQLLKGDFRWHVRKKDQINIESKLKTVRFIGELTKFKIYPKSEALHCLKMLMFDFSHHNIEMACSLLETCGRFLYRSADSHHRTKIYLDVMMRKKAALHLDSRYDTMIENAYYYCNPPDAQQITKKERPPMHEYIRKLLYKDLSKVTTEKVLRQMRKLDWENPEISCYTTKCMTAVWNVRYNSIHCLANLLAGLAPYHEAVAVQIVDAVLEDIRLGMEINHPRYNQRRVSCAKYLGELYNYRMVESSVIFKTLYSFITFGVSVDEQHPSLLDAPEHLFRIRLVCTLLETCGQYFDKGSSKRKLDCFLVYFQKYFWFKKSSSIWTEHRPFPIDISNLLKDTMELIRPKLKLCQNQEEAVKAVEDLESEFKPKLAEVLNLTDTEEEESSGAEDGGLSAIPESEEDYDDDMRDLSQVCEGLDSETSQEEQDQSQQSLTGSQNNEVSEENSDGEDDSDVLESAGEEDMNDQVNLLTGAPKPTKCAEDDDFMTAFDKMLTDNIQARTNESLKVPQLDIAVPMHLRGKSKKPTVMPGLVEDRSINFVLMTRRGTKQQFTDLHVPISEEFAAKFRERALVERAEKEQMKQVVLGIHERQEEEDYQEMLASLNRPVPLNTNRERRVRYQHPKGAPDADLIFGSKKR
ncbi:hypothetical protein ScPMuIL_009212 [Solemya velum]